jgi:hypothetical protein
MSKTWISKHIKEGLQTSTISLSCRLATQMRAQQSSAWFLVQSEILKMSMIQLAIPWPLRLSPLFESHIPHG